MTREEFVSKLPARIEDITFGECHLKILADNGLKKIACYMNKDIQIGWTMASTWDALYQELIKYLMSEKYL